MGCSLSAPATGGFSVVSPQYSMYAAGSEKEKRAGGPLHWGHHSTIVRILQWGVGGALPGWRVLLWLAPSFSGGSGLACAAIPPAPPSNVFQDRGTPPVTPGGAAPLHPAWGKRGFRGGLRPPSAGGLAWSRRCPTGPPSSVFSNRGTRCTPAGAAPPAPCLGTGVLLWLAPSFSGGLAWRAPLSRPHRPPTFSRTGGHSLSPPAGLRPCTPLGGNGGFVVACAHHQRGAWLGRAVAPLAHPPAFLATGGHAVPPAGAAPPAPCLGTEGDRDPLPSFPLRTGARMGDSPGVGLQQAPTAPVLGAIEQPGVSVSYLRDGNERASISVRCLRDGIERASISVRYLRDSIERMGVSVSSCARRHRSAWRLRKPLFAALSSGRASP